VVHRRCYLGGEQSTDGCKANGCDPDCLDQSRPQLF
jgi:hypothetical protein